MPRSYPWDYLPDFHNFEYIASVPWPGLSSDQIDWVAGVVTVEDWLEHYTGPKYSRWAWNRPIEHYQVSVAFKYDKHRTLFLLQWA